MLTWRQATVSRYGRTDQVLLAEVLCLWYGTYRSRAVRVVLVGEPGSCPKAGYHLALITTDLTSPTDQIVTRYAARSIVVLWYPHHGHSPQIAEDRRAQAPWYRSKTQPAYLDMIVKLRRTLITAQFRAGNAETLTPEEPLAARLAWAEAAA
jgi:hypothetical protein